MTGFWAPGPLWMPAESVRETTLLASSSRANTPFSTGLTVSSPLSVFVLSLLVVCTCYKLGPSARQRET